MKRWRNISLRVRLTLLYVGLLALLLAVLGGVLYWDFQNFLLESTATRLRAQAKPIIDEASAAAAPLENAQTLARDLTSRDTVALIIGPDGETVAVGKTLPEEPAPPPPDPAYDARALAGENEVTYVAQLNGQHYLVLLIPWRSAPGSPDILGVIQLSTPLAPVEKILLRQKLVLGLGMMLTLLAGLAGGLWLTSSALKPLNQMTETCERIAEGDLSQRVNLPEREDEIGRLAQAFDHMVARLEAAFAAQRRFVANAAHELRTPLTAIRGSLEVLMRGAQDDPAATSRLTQGMYREVVRLSRLSEQLLDLSRIGAGATIHKQPVDLQAFFDDFLYQARLLARDRTVTLDAGEPVTILADPDALMEMLFNLMDNAVQHTAENGVITLGWRTTPESVQLWVADDGEGIPADDLPRIFEPFYRGDSSRSRRQGGSGLGLALVQALVEAHGGRITVESQPGQGARFTITLPLTMRDVDPLEKIG